jgi:hypothetical protein
VKELGKEEERTQLTSRALVNLEKVNGSLTKKQCDAALDIVKETKDDDDVFRETLLTNIVETLKPGSLTEEQRGVFSGLVEGIKDKGLQEKVQKIIDNHSVPAK